MSEIMKAIVLNQHGGPDTLNFEEVAKPIPQNNQVLVKVKAAALNHVDIWIRKGIPAYPLKFPHILGSDGAGVVESVGPEAEGVSEGDRVVIIPAVTCGVCHFCQIGLDNQCEKFEIFGTKTGGTYAEYTLAPDQNLLTLPAGISFEEAAAFPLAHLTAWHMLMTKAQLVKEEAVLIIGSSAGVGVAAIQIAKWRGAKILGLTTQEQNKEFIKKTGDTDVLVWDKKSDFSTWVKEKTRGQGVKVVFEHVGPATFKFSLNSLAPYGRLVTCGATTGAEINMDLRTLFSRDLTITGARMGTLKEFQKLADLVFAGKIKPIINKTFPLEEAAQAHAYLEKGKQCGKVLLLPG